jgi:uncharacterized protein YbbC (DUF1343 family)
LYANQNCNGLEFLLPDPAGFRPVATGIALLQTITALYPEYCKERLYSTRVNPSGLSHLDKLLGVRQAFMKIKNQEVISTEITDDWRALIQRFLLY